MCCQMLDRSELSKCMQMIVAWPNEKPLLPNLIATIALHLCTFTLLYSWLYAYSVASVLPKLAFMPAEPIGQERFSRCVAQFACCIFLVTSYLIEAACLKRCRNMTGHSELRRLPQVRTEFRSGL
jgi:hypothetical protein